MKTVFEYDLFFLSLKMYWRFAGTQDMSLPVRKAFQLISVYYNQELRIAR